MDFLQLLISGISQGCVYGLIALGFVLIYKATEMVNFAQGDLMMLGAFCFWFHQCARLAFSLGLLSDACCHGRYRCHARTTVA
ncbi:MAG: hypothetical protein Ct9H300mP8_12370 [Gammaproteobacteria bacterium]|nr:MAG: hypothetical protein Ct9H300mP8_12370 [Gammaproteobacteria bacterium]